MAYTWPICGSYVASRRQQWSPAQGDGDAQDAQEISHKVRKRRLERRFLEAPMMRFCDFLITHTNTDIYIYINDYDYDCYILYIMVGFVSNVVVLLLFTTLTIYIYTFTHCGVATCLSHITWVDDDRGSKARFGPPTPALQRRTQRLFATMGETYLWLVVNIRPRKMVIRGMVYGFILNNIAWLKHQPHTVDGRNSAPPWIVETLCLDWIIHVSTGDSDFFHGIMY